MCCGKTTTKGSHKLLGGLGGLIYLFMYDKVTSFQCGLG